MNMMVQTMPTQSPPSPDESYRLLGVVETFRKEWDTMPMGVAALFVVIAQHDSRHEHLTVTEAGEKIGMAMASVSRNIQLLAHKKEERGQRALDLVEQRVHPQDYRRKVVYLTPRGRDLYARLASFMRSSAQ